MANPWNELICTENIDPASYLYNLFPESSNWSILPFLFLLWGIVASIVIVFIWLIYKYYKYVKNGKSVIANQLIIFWLLLLILIYPSFFHIRPYILDYLWLCE